MRQVMIRAVVLGLLALTACTTSGGFAGPKRPRDGLEARLCRTPPGPDTAALAGALLEGLAPELQLAVHEFDAASPAVEAAWVYEAQLSTRPASVHTSAVQLGVDVDGSRRAEIPMAYEVVAPLIGESAPAGHWEWVEVPPACEFSLEPISDAPLCRAMTTATMINPLAYALWPLFVPARRHERQPPTREDWRHIAPETLELFDTAHRLLPEAPPGTDWMTLDVRQGVVVVDAPLSRASPMVSVSVDAWDCDRRIAIDMALPMRGDSITDWIEDHRVASQTGLANATVLRVRELGTTAGLQQPDRDAVDAYVDGSAGVVCTCGPQECRCERRGPAVLRSSGLASFSWRTPLCCGSAQWPERGTCSCAPVACARLERRGVHKCVCHHQGGALDGDGWTPVQRCEPADKEVCCIDALGCTCSSHRGACYGDEVAVDACEPKSVTCREAPADFTALDGSPGYGQPAPACALP